MKTKQELAEQLLSLLVMDLNYEEEPLYGHTPLRHQFAWKYAKDVLGDLMQQKIEKRSKQRNEENETIGQKQTLQQKVLHQSEQITKFRELIEKEMAFMSSSMVVVFMKMLNETKEQQ